MLKTTSKIVAAGFVFVAPLIVILLRYQSREVTVVENTLGFVPLMFVVVITLVALSFFVNQFMEMVRTSRFGYLSITTFGAILATILFLSWTVLQWVITNARADLDSFVATFNYHQTTLIEMLVFIAIGITIAVVSVVTTIKKP